MKILMIVNELAFSGVPAACFNLSSELVRLGYKVFVVSASDGPQKELYEKMGVVVRVIPSILTDPSASYALAQQVDVALVNTLIGYNCIYGVNAARTPVLWGIHEPEFGVQMTTNNPIIRNALRMATFTIFPSKWSVKNYARFIDLDKANVIYTGTTIKPSDNYVVPFEKDPEALYVLQLGSIEPRKGQDVLIRAMEEVRTNVKVIISGRTLDQNYFNKLNETLNTRGIKSVKFTGVLNESSKAAVLQHCDALIMPSRDELIATVVIEAQALGKPVISSDVGALDEAVLDGKTGYIFPNENYKELAKKLDLLYTDKDKRESFGKEAKRLYETERSYQKFVSSYLNLITVAASQRRPTF